MARVLMVGKPLVKGRQVTGFYQFRRREAVGLTLIWLPFLLEDSLKEKGVCTAR